METLQWIMDLYWKKKKKKLLFTSSVPFGFSQNWQHNSAWNKKKSEGQHVTKISHVKPLVNIIPSDLNLSRVALNKTRIEVAVVKFLINMSMNQMFWNLFKWNWPVLRRITKLHGSAHIFNGLDHFDSILFWPHCTFNIL